MMTKVLLPLLFLVWVALAAEDSVVDAESEPVVLDTQPEEEDCRYIRGDWSACDATTSSRSRSMTLVAGRSSSSCPSSKTVSKHCKSACRFRKGDWTSCDPVTLTMSRTDTLKEGGGPDCQATRELKKDCTLRKQKSRRQGAKRRGGKKDKASGRSDKASRRKLDKKARRQRRKEKEAGTGKDASI